MKLNIGMKALIVHEGKVLILREAKYDEGTNTGKWDVPGGRIEPDEPFLHGMKREVMEESGLTVEPEEVLGVSENFLTIKGESCHIVRIYYQVKPLITEVALSGDHDQYEWISPSTYPPREFMGDIEQMLAKVATNFDTK